MEKSKFGHSLEAFKIKHGNVEGEKIWKDVQSRKVSCCFDFYLKMHNGDVEIASIEYQKRLEQCIPSSSSKEADTFLKKITELLLEEYDINKDDIITNKITNSELSIDNYFYDFFIKSQGIIIEYNGKVWHPDKEYYTLNEWNDWEHPYNKELTATEVYSNWKNKLNSAEKMGYKVIVVWSDKKETDNINYIKDKFKELIK